MKIKLSSIIILTLCCLVFLAMNSSASAQTIAAGVSKDEIFDYSYSIIWASTDPSAIPTNDLVQYNNTQKIQFKITSVSGPLIGVDFLREFKNGSQTVQSGTINVDTGTVTVPFGFLIIGANLSKNQQVYPNGGYQVITDTVIRSYASGQRETNVIINDESDEKITIYFDKVKGIAVEYSYQNIETSGGCYTTTINEILTNTNSDVWTVIPELSTLLVPLTLFVATAALLVARTAKKRRNL